MPNDLISWGLLIVIILSAIALFKEVTKPKTEQRSMDDRKYYDEEVRERAARNDYQEKSGGIISMADFRKKSPTADLGWGRFLKEKGIDDPESVSASDARDLVMEYLGWK